MILIRFALYAALTFVVNAWVYQTLYHGQIMYAITTLPGTFLHESMHYIMAVFLNGSPPTFSVLPTFDMNGNMLTMGHITYHPNWYNAAIVGMAPLLLAPMTAFFVALAARTMNPLKVLGWCYLAACAWQSCRPSDADFDTNGYPGSWLFAVPFLLASFYVTYRVTRATLRV